MSSTGPGEKDSENAIFKKNLTNYSRINSQMFCKSSALPVDMGPQLLQPLHLDPQPRLFRKEEALDWGCVIVLCYLQFLQLSRQPHVQGPGRQIALWVTVLAYACLTTQVQPLGSV